MDAVATPVRDDSARSALRAEWIDQWAAVQALEPEWNALLGASSADAIFHRWEWIRCWAEVLEHRIDPRVVAVRDAHGELVAVAPFYSTTFWLGYTIPVRVLRVFGDQPTSADYPDWIVRGDVADAASNAIAATLAANADWDVVSMPRKDGWTGSYERIVAACESSGLRCLARPHEFGVVELPREKDAYFRSLSGNKRQQLRAERNRIAKRAGVEMVRCESSAQLDELLGALFDLHARRWRERGELGSFLKDPRKASFYRRFAAVALERGWLCLYGLRDEGEFKAVQFGYVYRNTYHQIQEGFDPTYLKGAGNVLRARVIEDLIASRVEAYDFLGGMSEHKRRWLSRLRAGYDLMIGRDTLRSRLLFATGVWPTSRLMPEPRPRGIA